MDRKKIYKILGFVFAGVVAFLLYKSLSSVDWTKVFRIINDLSWMAFVPALGLSLLNYVILSSYDFLGLKVYKVKKLGYLKTIWSAFVCYAFNLNLGALVGGLGFRFRIYSNWGISKANISLIVFFSTLTNWLGYLFLLSLIAVLESKKIIAILHVKNWQVISAGVVGLGVTVGYFVMCFMQKEIKFRDHRFEFPDLKIASLQLFLSSAQWTLLGSILYYFLSYFKLPVSFSEALFVLLISGVAGVVTHIPGGIGVLEAIILKMNFEAEDSKLLAAALCYRIAYYFFPLILAIPTYLGLELYQKKK